MRLLFVFLLIFVSCKRTEVVDVEVKCSVVARKGDDTQITGKWKLVKASTVFMEPNTFDYSCNQVIYAFDQNGTLTITSNTEVSIGDKPGSYDYKFSKGPLLEGQNQKYTLTINQRPTTCGISEGVMTLDNSPADGPIVSFVRI